MAFVLIGASFLLIFFLTFDRHKMREIFSSLLLTVALALVMDRFNEIVPMWHYHGINAVVANLIGGLVVYPACTYLYLAFIPKTIKGWCIYTFDWMLFAVIGEVLLSEYGLITYSGDYNIYSSIYIDISLFIIVTQHYFWETRDWFANALDIEA